MNSGHDINGHVLGEVDMKPNFDDGNISLDTPNSQNVALWGYQRGSNAFINFNELRRSIRQATIHSMLYNKADDFWTYYTDKVFAPLTLFTSGFGLRVAGSEALHQILRVGLGNYIQDKIAFNAAKYKYINMTPEERQALADRLAMATTPADHEAVTAPVEKPISSNEVTDMIDEKEKQFADLEKTVADDPQLAENIKARGGIRPIGFVASKIAPYLASEKMDVLLNWFVNMHGMSIPPGVASDHLAHYALNASERAQQFIEQTGHGAKPGETFVGLTGNDPHYHAYWAQNLSKLRNEQMARDIANDYLRLSKNADFQSLNNAQKWQEIQKLHEARIANPNYYKDLRSSMVGLRDGVPSSFAQQQVQAFRGLVEGMDGTIHDNLIQNIANKRTTTADTLRKINPNSSPIKVLGKEPAPAMDQPLQRLMQLGYRTFINPIMDSVSREPIFGHYLYETYREYKPLIANGTMSESEALLLSGQRATQRMIPLIHNPALRSQFGMIARNFMPFYFAQEQAIKRYGRLVNTAPQAYRELQMINNGINNPGFVHQDSNGNKYIVYPVVGEFGNAVNKALNALGVAYALPSSVTGNTSSLATVLPEFKMPGINNVAAVPAEAILNHTSWGKQLTSVATGGYPQTNWLDVLFPNSAMRDTFQALLMDEKESSVHNAILSAMAAAWYHGDLPDNYASLPAWRQQQIVDRIDNNARTNLFMKGLFSFFAPLSPNVSSDYYNKNLQTLRSEFQGIQSQINPATNQKYTLQEATAKFLADHGKRSDGEWRGISYTAYTTKTGMSGADLPLNDTTLAWLNNNKSLLNTYQNGAAYLIPQSAAGPDALKVEGDLLAKHFRSKETPQEFMDSLYIAKGWADVSDMYKGYEDAMKEARNTGDKRLASEYTQYWNAFAQKYGASNPTWYADYSSPNRLNNAAKSLADLQKMNDKGLINGPQASGIKELLQSYGAYHSMLLANTMQTPTGTRQSPMYTTIQNQWFNYLTELETNQPNLTNVINSVFKRVK